MSELKRELHPTPKSADATVTDSLEQKELVTGDTDVLSNDHPGRPREPKRRRRLTLAVLPTMLTLGNGVCGLAAIAIAMSDNPEWTNETQLLIAGTLIFGGMLFDALDGSAARMTGQESQFGAELDSLCDAITFGTAPAVIVWQYSYGMAMPQKLSWGIGVLFTLCVLIRLARFNVETDEDDSHDGFDGLPSPAAAGTLASFAIAMPELAGYASDSSYPESVQWTAQRLLDGSQFFMAGLTLVLAYLMVSRFQYKHVFQQLVQGRRAPHQIGQALFVLIGASVLHWLALPVVFCYYAFAPPLQSLLQRKP
ncbi:phosphatidylcholine/phosphatidylserine synthase [bacterium]|nr:phosphatidylcholine/phosphatidylserine synthase [bacterium]